MKKKIYIVLFITLFFISSFSHIPSIETKNSAEQSLHQQNTGLLELENHRVLDINIVLFNYNKDQVFLDSLNAQLKHLIDVKIDSNTIYTYNINFNYIFPNQSLTDDFNSFIMSVSKQSSTVDLNQTALQIQALNNREEDIFYTKNGTAIDGIAVEDWLWANYNQYEAENTSYQIFLLNLTFIDDFYWFEIPEIDEMSGVQRTWWRLEWDYPPTERVNNYDVKFPYPGYSSHYPLYFLDPSAFNWYLNWTRLWRNVPDDLAHRHYKNTFKTYIQNLGGFSSSTNKQLAGSFLGDWLNEIVGNTILLNPLGGKITIPQSLTLQLAVFTDDTASNPYPDVTWTINQSLVIEKVKNLIPQTQVSVEVGYYRLQNETKMKNILDSYQVDPFNISNKPMEQYKYYDGFNMFTPVMAYDSQYFTRSNSETLIRGYIFLLDNASFQGAPWNGGGLFTGLGGGGRLLILNEIDRMFFNRTTNPVRKESLSKVLIHETGHAIGLPHPFNSGSSPQFASDFIGEVMGYYSSSADYSFLFKSNFQRLSLEPRIDQIKSGLINLSIAEQKVAKGIYNDFLRFYRKLDFNNANNSLQTLSGLINNEIIIENPVTSPYFTTIPSINDNVMYINTNNLLIWKASDQNPYRYELFINGSLVKSGTWDETSSISYNFVPNSIGTYNITMVLYDAYLESISSTVIISVRNLERTEVKNTETGSTEVPTTSTPASFLFAVTLLPIYAFVSLKQRKKQK